MTTSFKLSPMAVRLATELGFSITLDANGGRLCVYDDQDYKLTRARAEYAPRLYDFSAPWIQTVGRTEE